MKKKVKSWIKRYMYPELFGTTGALVGSWVAFFLTGNRLLAAYSGTIIENVGYYGCIVIREHINDLKKSRLKGKKHGVKGIFKTARNLIAEFGPAEILDSFVIRPFCMFTFPLIINPYTLGVFVGMLVADIIFYVPTIIAYELRKKYLK